MIPIYSIEHGLKNLGKNKNTFERGQELLRDGKMLLIFPEGFSRFSKQLASFKKGAARVALQTAFEGSNDCDLNIQVVSINYSFHGFGSILHIRIGDSMMVKDYRENYFTTPNHAIAALNKDMMDLFEKNVIHVKQGERTLLAESLIRISVDNKSNGEFYFLRSRKLCDHISYLDNDQFKSLQQKFVAYDASLQHYNINDSVIKNQSDVFWVKVIFWVLTAPIALIGFLFWHLIYFSAKWIADKTVTREDFYTSVFSGVLGVLGFIWFLILIGFALSLHNLPGLFVVLFSPFIYMLSLRWLDELHTIFSIIRLNGLKRQNKSAYENLLIARQELVPFD
jgi:hypothetical protein